VLGVGLVPSGKTPGYNLFIPRSLKPTSLSKTRQRVASRRTALLPHYHREPIELREVSLISGDLETVSIDVDEAKTIDLLEYVFGKPELGNVS